VPTGRFQQTQARHQGQVQRGHLAWAACHPVDATKESILEITDS
jgi:hypothetical protein